MPDSSGNPGSFAARARIVSRLGALAVFLVGVTVLVGWVFQIEGLKRIYGNITMKGNTAICLMLLAASVWTLTIETESNYKVFGQVCAVTAGIVGLLTLSEHVVGWNLHLDQLLFTESAGAPATMSPGRMGITSSSCFTLFSAALTLLYRRRAFSVAQILTMAAGFWALLANIGYAYGAQALFGIAKYTGIAFPTAIALLVLSISILGACIDGGVCAIVCEETTAGVMSRRLLVVAVVVPFVLGRLLVAGQRAGYFDLGFGSSLLVAAIILTFLLAIWRAAVRLRYADQRRTLSEDVAKTERHKAKRAGELLASIVESSEDAIISKTLDGIIDSWNVGAERLFEYPAAEAIGKPITLIVPPERLDEEEMILQRLRQGKRVEAFETVRMSKSGKRINVSLAISPILDDEGSIVGASKIARDISERRQAELEREQLLAQERMLRAEAENAARLKDEFLATVSHELRTPLNAILGWSSMLARAPHDKSIADRGIEAIQRNAKSQAQLIEDLLDVSRIISGKVRLDVQPVALSTIVKNVIESVQPAADAKEIQLRMIVDPVAENVKADATRLQQGIWNLVDNAIKFTPPNGSVTVRIERLDSMAQVTVTDTGEGISPDFLPYVFDRFKQADGTTTRRHGGLGLGLAIARHLMEMHGGAIEAESAGLGAGASFRIRIPLTPIPFTPPITAGPRSALSTSPPSNSVNLHGIRILVVDDEEDAREMLKAVLERFGADVAVAPSAQDALAVLLSWKPSVIVSDIGMPTEDGYALIGKIRSLPRSQGGDCPAIALTGYVRIEERMRALAAGYQMFVPKPVEIDELTSAITNLLDNRGQINSLSDKSENLREVWRGIHEHPN